MPFELSSLPYENRLSALCLERLELKRDREDLIVFFEFSRGLEINNWRFPPQALPSLRLDGLTRATRGHRARLVKQYFDSRTRNEFSKMPFLIFLNKQNIQKNTFLPIFPRPKTPLFSAPCPVSFQPNNTFRIVISIAYLLVFFSAKNSKFFISSETVVYPTSSSRILSFSTISRLKRGRNESPKTNFIVCV